eukprot:SAG25_NODE_885_length_4932_cov_8.691082_2_plen_292_part_00
MLTSPSSYTLCCASQVVKTRARYPNRVVPDAREDAWGHAGKNATWQTRQPVIDRGHQIVVNATRFIPKNVTSFPDYYVYGTGGACAAQGYDPPGGWLCADHGGMHGGTYNPSLQRWTGGYPKPFPASVRLSHSVKQSVFPNSAKWCVEYDLHLRNVVHCVIVLARSCYSLSEAIVASRDIFGGGKAGGNGTRAKLRAWVNGWFTSMWEIDGWNETTSQLDLGKGGFHGGQPVYLQSLNPDGSWGGEAFGFRNNTLNATNRINAGDMDRIFVEDLLAEVGVRLIRTSLAGYF